jgi:branched-chain amino acid transport system permease protein
MRKTLPLLLFGLLLLLPLGVHSRYLLHICISIFFFGYLATCWNILGGLAGQHSFGHAIFVGVGAYTSSLLFAHLGVTPWLGMLGGGVLAGLVGVFIGYLCFRYGLRGPYFLLVTIAFGEVFVYAALNIRAVGGGSGITVPLLGNAPSFFQFEGKTPYYYIILAMAAGAILVTSAIQRSRIGYYLIAIRENENAAQALGINLLRYKITALSISAFLSALGGTFYAQYFFFIDPPSTMGLGLSIEIVIYAIVGGVGTLLGPICGACLLVPIAEATRTLFAGQTGGIHLMVYGVILVVAIIFMPGGIVGFFSRISGRRSVSRQGGISSAAH